MIAACNIRNYSIYLHRLPDGNHYLFSYFEYVGSDFAGDMAKMAADVPPSRGARYDFLDWIAGCVLIYGALFGVGKVILKEYAPGAVLLAAAIAGGAIIYWDLSRRGWKTVVD
jgi:hypothetical protein